MTQFALAITKKSCTNLLPVSKQKNDFISEVAKNLFPYTPIEEIFVPNIEGVDIDQLMLDAQKAVNVAPFENTKLYNTICRILPVVEELVFWYGSDYEDLDYVHDVSPLLHKLKETVSESNCELYVHYVRSKVAK